MNDRSVLTLLVDERWSLRDLQSFLHAIDEVYGTFVALRIIRERMARAAGDAPLHDVGLADYLGESLPRGWTEEGASWAPQPVRRQLGLLPTGPAHLPELQYFEFVMQHRHEWLTAAALTINSIRMSSPGGVSLIGIGDVIRELRELLKDLRFRNRQEQQLGELEITRRRLELQDARLSPAALDAIAARTITALAPLGQLVSAKQLCLGTSLRSIGTEFIELLHALIAEKAPDALADLSGHINALIAAGGQTEVLSLDAYSQVTQEVADIKKRLRILRHQQLLSRDHYGELEELVDAMGRRFSVGHGDPNQS